MLERLAVIAAVVALSSCATTKISADQLARVAKDWSLGIRASQVIPVYPLTEDVQPGDVFLVQSSVEDQVAVYLEKGFLPLENLVYRLALKGYVDFYPSWPGVKDGEKAPPRPWQFTDGGADADYTRAPLAAFPSYGFSVSRSAGLSVAIPVQAVPVGLNLLGSASASGTITLKDAYTYALPARTIYDAVREWAFDNATYLAQFAPRDEEVDGKPKRREFYLRVVNRVYLVKTVDVTLFSDRATGVGVSAGVPQKVELLNIGNETDASKGINEVNKILSNASTPAPGAAPSPAAAAGAAPVPIAVGGTLRLAMATSRSVSLVETFKRPLVIGYLASDFKILENGQIDAPSPTLNLLEGRPAAAGKPVKYQGCDPNCRAIRAWIKEDRKANLKIISAWLATNGGGISISLLNTGPHAELRERVVNEVIKP